MYKKDDIVTVTILDCANEGEGIGKIDGYPFFIKDAVIGDVVEAKVMKAQKNYAFARLMKIVTPSEKRCEPRCSVAGPCGGCKIQAMDYEAQLRFKQSKVYNNLMRIGGIAKECLDAVMEPIIGMEDPWRYRNKAQYPVSRDRDGNIIIGFYAGRTHNVIPCEDCMIGPAHHALILSRIKAWMEETKTDPYDEKTGKGLVRHVLIRDGFATGEGMVCLVVNCEVKSAGTNGRWGRLVEALEDIPGIVSVQLNENREDTNVILGKNCKVLKGKDSIEDILCGMRFEISPLSFYQVNRTQAERLYDTALEFADLDGSEEVWDICCGIGTITLALARGAKTVHGLEIVPEAIANAWENAKRNHVENVDFVCAAAEEYMPAHKNEIRADVIVTDPPRKGMDERSLEVMVSMQPKKIVYVSCDSATLARDVKYLCAHGYELKRVRPADLFPHSVHVETVVLLSKGMVDKDKFRKVKVDFSLEDMDLTELRGKATYAQVKEYILNEFGLKVSSLYIAQVKKKCGLEVGENYNLPKAEDAKQPQVTPEKEEAIMKAFKHFGVI